MGKKLSKTIRKAHGVGAPSATEIKYLEQGAVQQVTLNEIINRSLKRIPSSEPSAVTKQG